MPGKNLGVDVPGRKGEAKQTTNLEAFDPSSGLLTPN